MDVNDIRFDREGYRFQLRAGAVIVEDGCVLLAKTDAADYYYSVGGAAHMGETTEQAVEREVFEETGIDYKVERLVFVHENFFVDEAVSKGVRFHEISFYYLMKPCGKHKINKESLGSVGRETMHWIPVCELKNHKVFPEFLTEEVLCDLSDVRHFVTNDITE